MDHKDELQYGQMLPTIAILKNKQFVVAPGFRIQEGAVQVEACAKPN
jgi:hypothetical protein